MIMRMRIRIASLRIERKYKNQNDQVSGEIKPPSQNQEIVEYVAAQLEAAEGNEFSVFIGIPQVLLDDNSKVFDEYDLVLEKVK